MASLQSVVEETSFKEKARSNLSLHEAAENGWKDEVLEILQGLSGDAKATAVNELDDHGWAALHYAAYYNYVDVMEELILNGADMKKTTTKWRTIILGEHLAKKRTALHLAAGEGHVISVVLLLNLNSSKSVRNQLQQTNLEHCGQLKTAEVNAEDDEKQTPLHCASAQGHEDTVTVLLEHGAEINKETTNGRTALHEACAEGHAETVRVLLRHKADVCMIDSNKQTAVHLACRHGRTEVVKLLLVQETADFAQPDGDGNSPLMLAILEGHEDTVKVIINSEQWKRLFQTCKDETTPTREVIKKMPNAAATLLDRCIEPNTDSSSNSRAFSVHLDYSLLEDFQDHQTDVSLSSSIQEQDGQGRSYLPSWVEKWVFPVNGGFTTTWGPVGFDWNNHPLNFIAQSKNLQLLKHPLVTNLLSRKWKVAQIVYFSVLLFYCISLAFLSAFSLTAPNPLSESCQLVFLGRLENTTFVGDCGQSDSRQQFVFTAGVLVIIFAIIRLMYQFIKLYFIHWMNGMEVLTTVLTIIFTWVFHTDCLCVYQWQWQIGTVAVFLAWFDLVIFLQQIPGVGIYIGMLKEIMFRFTKTVPLAVVLVIAFGLGFFMLFSEPGRNRTSFATPAQALLSIVTYSTGELNYQETFRLRAGGDLQDEELENIPFPPVSYVLWIIFIIVMPILLSNMLTALAFEDTTRILENAEAKTITLKIQLILNFEASLPAKLRRKFIVGQQFIYPNELSLLQRMRNKLQLGTSSLPGEQISEALNEEDNLLKHLPKQTLSLLKAVCEMKMKAKDSTYLTLSQLDILKSDIQGIKNDNAQTLSQLTALKVDMKQSMSQLSVVSKTVEDMRLEMLAFRNAMQQFTDRVYKKL